MTIWSWDPTREFDALRREVERAFETFGFDRGGRPLLAFPFLPGRSARAYPLLNMSEDKENVYVEALAPGLNPETLEVTVVRDTLRIAGEKQPLSEQIKPEAFHRTERGAGKFARTLTLPIEVDGEKVKASYTNGLLLITLPKAEQAKPKQISVSVS